MLYRLLKPIVQLAMFLFCRRVIINKPELLKTKGPLLIACNHPNSFLDSVILDTLFEQPIWSLARGDAFKTKRIARLLHALKILPVYRTSEGVENLGSNYKTFDACLDIFRNKGLVQIFSEGKCINEWHLRPLKKGTARLAIRAWEENIPLRVLPVGINYSSYHRFGKNIFLRFGEIITREDICFHEPDGLRHQSFNRKLEQQLSGLVFEISKKDKKMQEELLTVKLPPWQKILLAVPAAAGWLLHAPIYMAIKKVVWKKAAHNDHFDSIMTGALLIAYPLYLLLLVTLVWLLTHSAWALFLFLLLPFTAWAHTRLKGQLDR